MKTLRIAVPVTDQDPENYVRALAAAQMEPVVLLRAAGAFSTGACDGLLLPGGGDIDPARYGQENTASVGIEPALDEWQFTVLDAFVREGRPVLGICRGHQLINVYFGGTLIQHLPSAARHARKADEPDRIHTSKNQPGSWLEGLYGLCFTHNSSHHQAVDVPGTGLLVDSVCPDDGTVEGMHHTELPVWSVQWHPERMCLEHARKDTADGLPVFRFFRENSRR